MTHLHMLFAVCLLLVVVGTAGFCPFGSSPVAAATENANEQLKALPGTGDTYSEKNL